MSTVFIVNELAK